MQKEERLITIENRSDEAISDMWDGAEYAFAPHEAVQLRYGVGLHFMEKHPEFAIVSETKGFPPGSAHRPVQLTLKGEDETLNLMWDGVEYVFLPDVPATLEYTLAVALVEHSRRVLSEKESRGRLELTEAIGDEAKAEESEPAKPKGRNSKKPKAEESDDIS